LSCRTGPLRGGRSRGLRQDLRDAYTGRGGTKSCGPSVGRQRPLFAKEHPQEAAFGDRRYSIDTYSSGPVQANGQHTEIHGTIGFLDIKPTYNEVRTRFLAVAQGQASAMSSTVHHVK